jgi:periplasmic divalent cation tolerance protein
LRLYDASGRTYNRAMTTLLEVHTTFATPADAVRVARVLISEQLAACAQVIPEITSLYMWEEELKQETEALLLLKAEESSWVALRDRLAELHPYDTPEIIALPVSHASFEYATWVRDSCRTG